MQVGPVRHVPDEDAPAPRSVHHKPPDRCDDPTETPRFSSRPLTTGTVPDAMVFITPAPPDMPLRCPAITLHQRNRSKTPETTFDSFRRRTHSAQIMRISLTAPALHPADSPQSHGEWARPTRRHHTTRRHSPYAPPVPPEPRKPTPWTHATTRPAQARCTARTRAPRPAGRWPSPRTPAACSTSSPPPPTRTPTRPRSTPATPSSATAPCSTRSTPSPDASPPTASAPATGSASASPPAPPTSTSPSSPSCAAAPPTSPWTPTTPTSAPR